MQLLHRPPSQRVLPLRIFPVSKDGWEPMALIP
jgi:hypothetical protein